MPQHYNQQTKEVKGRRKLSKEEDLDTELATLLAFRMLDEGGGLDVLGQTLSTSQDPAQVTGQFLAQLIVQMAESFPPELGISPNIYLAGGGVLENILNYIEGQLGLPKEFSEQVYQDVLEIIKAAAMNPPQEGGAPQGGPPAQPQPAAGPVPPQGGGLQGMAGRGVG